MQNLATMGGLTEHDLAQRRHWITATDAAKIMGTSPFGTSYDVYLEKCVEMEPRDDSPALLWGRMMEPVILSFAEITLRRHLGDPELRLTKAGVRRRHRNNAMSATLDALVKGHRAAIEAKTHAAVHGRVDLTQWGEEEWSDAIPPYYLDQVLHQLACAPDLDRIYVVLSVARGVPKFYCVERSLHLDRIAQIENACCDFMEQHIQPNIPPTDVGPTMDAVRRVRVPATNETPVQLDDVRLERSKKIGSLLNRLKKHKDDLDASLKASMIGAKFGISPKGHRLAITSYNHKTYTVEGGPVSRMDITLTR